MKIPTESGGSHRVDLGCFLPLVIAPGCGVGVNSLLTNSLMPRVISYYLVPYFTDCMLENKRENMKSAISNMGKFAYYFFFFFQKKKKKREREEKSLNVVRLFLFFPLFSLFFSSLSYLQQLRFYDEIAQTKLPNVSISLVSTGY